MWVFIFWRIMKKEKLEKQLAELNFERMKLIKVKSASPTEIMDRIIKINKRIQEVEEKLNVSKTGYL